MERLDQGYELLDHTADVGIRAWGNTREELFHQAALGLYAVALDPAPRTGELELDFSVPEAKDEERLVRFLSELLFILDSRRLAAVSLELGFTADGRLEVHGRFARVRPEDVVREIKSPTYHQLQVQRTQTRWETILYFDL